MLRKRSRNSSSNQRETSSSTTTVAWHRPCSGTDSSTSSGSPYTPSSLVTAHYSFMTTRARNEARPAIRSCTSTSPGWGRQISMPSMRWRDCRSRPPVAASRRGRWAKFGPSEGGLGELIELVGLGDVGSPMPVLPSVRPLARPDES
jgi:hypothetical protein